jgi:polyisoprenoid-binding protein YceI
MDKARMDSTRICGGALATAIAFAWALPATAADYVQAQGSRLVFASQFEGETFSGRFPGFATRLHFDPARPQDARLDVAIPLAGAVTGNRDRDDALRGADFFHVARFPQARYRAEGFRHLGGDRYAADGLLSLRGLEKPVTLEFTWTPGPRPVLVGRATVPRLAFGVGGGDWADTMMLPDAVAVSTRVVFEPAPTRAP